MRPESGHSLLSYIFVTFFFSWSFWFLARGPGSLIIHARVGATLLQFSLRTVLQWAGVFAPGVIALFFVSSEQSGVANFFRYGFLRPSISKASAGAILISLTASLPTFLFYGPNLPVAQSGLRFLINTSVNLPLGPFWEEIGWRGFLFPRVQSSFGTLRSCLIVGIVWAFWHLPLRASSGPPPHASQAKYLLSFCAYTLALSFVLGWLHNRAKGALLPCIVLHSGVNALSNIIDEPVMAIVGLTPLFLSTAVLGIIAFLLHLLAPSQLDHAGTADA